MGKRCSVTFGTEMPSLRATGSAQHAAPGLLSLPSVSELQGHEEPSPALGKV